MWSDWLTKFSGVLNKHAPFRKKRTRIKKSPWINSVLIKKMRESDTLKKQFGRTHDEQIWSQYKIAHNDVNRLIKQTKREYFTSRIDAAKMIRDQHGD